MRPDNSLTAMTGGQSHPGLGGKPRKDEQGAAVPIETAAHGCGVTFVEIVGSYDTDAGIDAVKRAWEYAKSNQTPAVVIFRRPCMLLRVPQDIIPVAIKADKCVGCRYCIEYFGCPGLSFDENRKKTSLDTRYCVSCGVCKVVCPHGAIVDSQA